MLVSGRVTPTNEEAGGFSWVGPFVTPILGPRGIEESELRRLQQLDQLEVELEILVEEGFSISWQGEGISENPTLSRWWFQILFIFIPIWGRFPF